MKNLQSVIFFNKNIIFCTIGLKMQRKNVFSQNACVHTEQVAGMMANVGRAARRRRLSFPQQQMSPPLSIGLH